MNRLLPAWLVVSVISWAGASIVASAQKPLATYSAQAVNLDGGPGAVTGLLQIQVTRWSSDAERDRVTEALVEKGEDSLLEVISKLPSAGTLRTPSTVGHPLRYARRTTTGTGGETIVIITNRPMSFGELRNAPPSRDYPFTVIRLQLNSQGQGQGQLMIATRIMADKATKDIAFENFTAGVVQLQNVRRE
jgi:hypothetical protein